MAYIEKHIMAGETLVYRTRPHKICCLRPAALVLTGLALGLLAASRGLFWGGISVAAAAMAVSLPKWVRYLTSEYGVTNRRVFLKSGWLSHKSSETSLNKVGVITVDQSVCGRLLGYGDLVVSGFGGKMDGLQRIPAPLQFRKKIFEQIARLKHSPASEGVAYPADWQNRC